LGPAGYGEKFAGLPAFAYEGNHENISTDVSFQTDIAFRRTRLSVLRWYSYENCPVGLIIVSKVTARKIFMLETKASFKRSLLILRLSAKSRCTFCAFLQKVVALFAPVVYNTVRGGSDETIRD
jgi:hypothetical protein